MKTIEEKAKAYDEALERAKAYHRNELSGSRKEMMEYIFPQLRESEDEKVMKILFDVFADSGDRFISEYERGLVFSWLKKQERKSVEIDEIIRKARSEGRQEVVDNPEYYHLLKQEEMQNPAEWSEEDEKVIRTASAQLTHYGNLLYNDGERTSSRNVLTVANKLKSLRPQSKPEVTDEEIEEMVTKRSRSTGTTKSEMAFYRNGIKDAIKRFGLRPGWKPSEEQMNALNFAITYFMHETNYKNPTELRELYEQLKKL